jgi:hypothetical protein
MSAKRPHTNKGHRALNGERAFRRYSVYRNKDDMPVIIDGTAEECAKAMGVTLNSFYRTVCRAKQGRLKRYTVIWRYMDETEEDL